MRRMKDGRRHLPASRGLTLLEVLVGLAILTAGLVSIAAVFPYTLKAQRHAEMLTLAAPLAQMKVEEIRLMDDRNGRLKNAIRALTEPTPPIAFLSEPRLAYSFCGRTLMYAGGDPADPRATPGVARVIIRYAAAYRPEQGVVYELRF